MCSLFHLQIVDLIATLPFSIGIDLGYQMSPYTKSRGFKSGERVGQESGALRPRAL
jgi:hypothetical protein